MVHSQTARSRPLKAVAGHGATGRQPQRMAAGALHLEAVESIANSSQWDVLAACRDEDPELFFPVGTKGPAKQQEAEAKAVCARCLVRSRCLQVALETGDDYGVRGGMTEQERRDVIRNAKKSAAKTSVAGTSAPQTQPRQSA